MARPSWTLNTVEDGAIVRYRMTFCDHTDEPVVYEPIGLEGGARLIRTLCPFCKNFWLSPMHGYPPLIPQGVVFRKLGDQEE